MSLSSARMSANVRLCEAATNARPLASGETGRAVEILQQCLSELVAPMPRSTKPSGLMDGIFGAETEAAVKAFQAKNGLKSDGMAGPLTLSRIDAFCLAREKQEEISIRSEANLQPPFRRWNAT